MEFKCVFTFLILLGLFQESVLIAETRPNQAKTRITVWTQCAGKLPFVNDAPALSAFTFHSAVRGHLLYTNSTFELKPSFIRSWKWDPEEQSYYIELGKDIQFHNGRTATAEDLEFSIARGLFAKTDNFFRMFFANIQGVDEIKPGSEFLSGGIKGIKIIDSHHLRIKMGAPNPSFLHNLSYSYVSLVPKEEMQKDLVSWKNLPVGAGSYKVTSVDYGKLKVSLEKVKPTDTPDAADEIDFVTSKEPVTSDLVLWETEPQPPPLVRTVGPTADVETYILFNYNHPLAVNSNFRKAISLALNRSALAEGFDSFVPAFEFLPGHFWGRCNAREGKNIEKARGLVSTLPSELRAMFQKVHTIPVRTISLNEKVLNRLKKQLEAIGFNVTFVPKKVQFWDPSDKDTLLSIYGYLMADVDPILKFGMLRKDGPVFPFCPRKDTEFEKLYHEAAVASSLDIRAESVKKLSQYVHDQVTLVPLLERRPVHWYNPKTISSLGLQDGGGSFYLERVSVLPRAAR